ncbi:hypothetical protein PTQ55_24420 [Klebsiella pasteurii]|uniref:hypothetical protein n=1 Tax=Klebsiella pasteurii TaxID=2587529 RepID=UPI00287D3957|nr:hypothetical protein [Klebsiella pasteurii]MDS7914575.1 hypothetical protein [Klebsiella pasteurii]
MGEISVKTGNNARNGGKNSLNRLIRCVCGKKIGPDPRNFNQRVSLGRNDLLIRTFPKITGVKEQTSRNAVRHIKNDLNFPDRDYIILSSIYALSYGRVVGDVIKILKGNVNSLLIQ